MRQAIPWQVDVTTMPKSIKLSCSTKTNLSIKLITVGNVRKVNGIADPEANQEWILNAKMEVNKEDITEHE